MNLMPKKRKQKKILHPCIYCSTTSTYRTKNTAPATPPSSSSSSSSSYLNTAASSPRSPGTVAVLRPAGYQERRGQRGAAARRGGASAGGARLRPLAHALRRHAHPHAVRQQPRPQQRPRRRRRYEHEHERRRRQHEQHEQHAQQSSSSSSSSSSSDQRGVVRRRWRSRAMRSRHGYPRSTAGPCAVDGPPQENMARRGGGAYRFTTERVFFFFIYGYPVPHRTESPSTPIHNR